MAKLEPLLVNFVPAQKRQLEEYARENGLTMGAVVRIALAEKLDREGVALADRIVPIVPGQRTLPPEAA